MNKSNDTTKTDFQAGSQISARQRIAPGSLALMRRIVIACVAIEFVAIVATVVGVTPMVFWVAIAAATISAVVAFVMAWQVFHPLAGMVLAALNALSCYRIWSVRKKGGNRINGLSHRATKRRTNEYSDV